MWGAAMALLLAGPAPARAHSTSQGRSTWTVTGTTVTATLMFTAADLQEIVLADTDRNGRLDAGEAAAAAAPLSLHLSQTLRAWRVGSDGARDGCSPVVDGPDVDGVTQGYPPAYPVHVRFVCPAPLHTLALGFHVFVGTTLRHVHLASITMPSGTQQVMFTPDMRQVTLEANPDQVRLAAQFVRLGVEHILLGWDHLTFLMCLLVMARGWRSVVMLVTSFTAAHSITLACAVLGLFSVSPRVVEPAIAASIVCVAGENLWMLRRGRKPVAPRAAVTFLFGLVHGFGFAAVLLQTPMPPGAVALALGGFNVGVELGQLAACAVLLAALWPLRGRPAQDTVWVALSAAGGLAGTWWLLSRLAAG